MKAYIKSKVPAIKRTVTYKLPIVGAATLFCGAWTAGVAVMFS
jgi:hypothetical protein